MAVVRLDAMLREFVPRSQLRSDATTLGALLDELETQYPRLRSKLRDEAGTMRPFVQVFVDGAPLPRGGSGPVSLVGARTVDILHSIAGG